MTTKQSPLRVLKAQSDKIAQMLKAFERGEPVQPQFAEQMRAARAKETFKFAIPMDDQILSIEMPWTMIKEFGEVALSEYILKATLGVRDN